MKSHATISTMNENPSPDQNQQNDNQPLPPQPAPQAPQSPPVPPVTAVPTNETSQNTVVEPPIQQNPFDVSQPIAPAEADRGMFDRRIGRLGYFLGFVYLFVPTIILFLLVFILIPLTNGRGFGEESLATTILNTGLFLFGMAYIILLIPVTISLYVRRLHDLNKSWVWLLLMLVPLADLFFGFYLLLAPGDKQANQYGEPVTSLGFLTVLGFKKP